MKQFWKLFLMTLVCTGIDLTVMGSEPVTEDGWTMVTDEATGIQTHSKELTLHPQAEPKPALKYRLIPDEFDLLEGNAALYYLKAMGFFEQTVAQERLREFHKAGRARAEEQKVDMMDVAPNSYLKMAPDKLPIEEVTRYLDITHFQRPYLEEARRLRSFSLDRNIRQVDNPIGYLLPEMQAMRELARTQSIRNRLAIAEGRIDDAVTILGQQTALAKHLGSDEFYVSALIGAAIQSVAWNDALYLIQQPDAPNLYWAFASLPIPLIDMRRAHAFERQFLFEQVKMLRDVDETPRPAGYWQTFIDGLVPQLRELDYGGLKLQSMDDFDLQRASIVAFVAASYPGAKRYLIEEGAIALETIDAYPTAQVVFLAVKKFYEEMRDEYFKWNYLPVSQASSAVRKLESQFHSKLARLGWPGKMVNELLPAPGAVRKAQGRVEQCIALIQTVEAIRMYGAVHGGKLPDSLNELPVPVPSDPFSDGPLSYELSGDSAVLSGRAAGQIRYRLVLKFATGGESKR